eukprot:gene10527-14143_t
MIELRQRSSSKQGYAKVSTTNTDDESESIPMLNVYKVKKVPKPRSNFSSLLFRDSLYIRVSPVYSHSKPKLARSVFGAIFLYIICMAISAFLWYRSTSGIIQRDSPRFVD